MKRVTWNELLHYCLVNRCVFLLVVHYFDTFLFGNEMMIMWSGFSFVVTLIVILWVLSEKRTLKGFTGSWFGWEKRTLCYLFLFFKRLLIKFNNKNFCWQ